MYEIIEHTADLGIRVQADDLNSLFGQAGQALFAVVVQNLEDVRCVEEVKLEVQGQQIDFLLVDWLSELLFIFESRDLLLGEFAVQLSDKGLTATVSGEVFDPARHRLEHEVKAITYHRLYVEQTERGWAAEVIFDI